MTQDTSNINALDVINRAAAKDGAHLALQRSLHAKLREAAALPTPFRAALGSALDRAVLLVDRVAEQETLARQAATALYDAASAVLLAWEGSRPGADARRALVARFVLAHRLSPFDPLAPEAAAWETAAADALLGSRRPTMHDVAPLLA